MKEKMKTFLCVVLCISLLLPAAVTANAESEKYLSVWVMSDPHYRPHSMLGPIGEQTGLPGDPLYWHTNTTGQLTYESEAVINEFLKRFEASSSDILLVAGDLTDDGYLPEHQGISEKFKQFEEKTGKKIFVINGNHDIRGAVTDRSINLSDFKSIYSDFGYSEALAQDENSASYTADLDGKYRLIAIDAVVNGTDKSVISPDLFSWIETQVNQAKADGKKLVGMIHYSILEHFKNQNLAVKYIMVEDYRDISTKLADWGVKVVFTGHVHGNDISGAVSDKGNTVYDVETCSLIAYPNTYREVTFSDESVKIESKNIDKINTADLVDGYTPAQLDLLENDFQTFSYGFFKAFMNCFISRYIASPASVAKALKVEKGTPAYEALSAVMKELGASLTLPLYDKQATPETDSVEEIAAKVGERVDTSGYKNLPDIVGSVLAAHYSGVENIPYDSPEIRLFKQCFKSALVYSLVSIPVGTANVLFKELGLPASGLTLSNNDYTGAAKLIYMKTAASKLINAVIEPVLQGFTADSYAPADLNVTLEGYDISGNITGGVLISNVKYYLDLITRLFGVIINAVKALITI